jgi:glutathione S-transferase
MALATALELGVDVENKVINVFESEFLDQMNPLRQIPTLLLDDGRAIFDSRVIVAYFCSLRSGRCLNPVEERWDVQTSWALAIGVMEAGVGRVMELQRPQDQRSSRQIEVFDRRIANSIARFEAFGDQICSDVPRIDRLALAVALEYIDFRIKLAWRRDAPRLKAWLEAETLRPSLVATRPRERE